MSAFDVRNSTILFHGFWGIFEITWIFCYPMQRRYTILLLERNSIVKVLIKRQYTLDYLYITTILTASQYIITVGILIFY